ncbi:MAG TPA: hypothetical protein VIV11_08595, partial [Kofleriaceae bacterium]
VKHLTITPIPPSRVQDLPHVVPPELEDAILACMEKDENGRPHRIDIVADQLEAIAEANGWELPTYTAIPRSSAKYAAASGPTSGPIITPLRRTPAKGVPALGHAPTLEIQANNSATNLPAVAADTSQVTSLPPAPPAKRWPLFAAAAAVLAAGIAFVVVNLAEDKPATPAPVAEPQQPPPASEPMPAPAVAEKIEIEIVTTPEGAEVVRAEDGRVLGTTPLTLPFERSDRIEELELRLAGFVAQAQRVKLDRGARISTVLVAEHKPAEPEDKRSRSRSKGSKKTTTTTTTTKSVEETPAVKDQPKPDRTGVMDPFK